MVRWIRSARVSTSRKFVEALSWAKDVAAFVEGKHKVPTIGVYVDASGQMPTIRWVIDYDNLASVEATQARIAGDTEYHQKLRDAESKGLFISGQIVLQTPQTPQPSPRPAGWGVWTRRMRCPGTRRHPVWQLEGR
jgi:NIPSNAP protein